MFVNKKYKMTVPGQRLISQLMLFLQNIQRQIHLYAYSKSYAQLPMQ